MPTFREPGHDIVEGDYRSAAAPPGTPDEIVKVLADAMTGQEGPRGQKKVDQNGLKTEFMGPEDSLALVKKKMVEYEVIMKGLGRTKKWAASGSSVGRPTKIPN